MAQRTSTEAFLSQNLFTDPGKTKILWFQLAWTIECKWRKNPEENLSKVHDFNVTIFAHHKSRWKVIKKEKNLFSFKIKLGRF